MVGCQGIGGEQTRPRGTQRSFTSFMTTSKRVAFLHVQPYLVERGVVSVLGAAVLHLPRVIENVPGDAADGIAGWPAR